MLTLAGGVLETNCRLDSSKERGQLSWIWGVPFCFLRGKAESHSTGPQENIALHFCSCWLSVTGRKTRAHHLHGTVS